MTQQPEDAPSSPEAVLSAATPDLPTLFDIVLPGERARELDISLANPAATSLPERQPLDLDQRIQAAVEAALPKVTERTAAALRDALLQEVQDALDAPEQ